MNAIFCEVLAARARDWDKTKRRAMARIFASWASQLIASAETMNAAEARALDVRIKPDNQRWN